ncbi:MAG: 30S ribosomal protein S16 [Bacteroidota bacterium]|nr:30S ribosomal protein S16 [Bacteroidota bacterium]
MSVKIRLQRHGRKKQPYYFIVVTDSRTPRDGKFIERIGSYNPNTNPATIDLNGDKALEWVEKGAIPTETCRAILSYKGIMYRKHLHRGVRKGAFSQEDADQRFAEWLGGKAEKIEGKISKLQSDVNQKAQERSEIEAEVARKRADAIRAKYTPAEEPEEAAAEPEANTETQEGDNQE